MTYATLGALLAQYVLKRGIGRDEKAYTKSLWEDVKALLEEFVKYLEDENLDSYAANCLNAGYRSLRRKETFKVKIVADRLMCTLMSRALFFMNRWPQQSGVSHEREDENAALKEYIRCAIVNIFMSILLASPCKSQMGIDNAWYTMKELEKASPGLIKGGKCGQGVFQNIQTQQFDMGHKIQEWLEKNKKLTEDIGRGQVQGKCKEEIKGLDGATKGTHNMDEEIEMKTEERDAIRELGQQLKTIVQEVKTGAVQCAQTPGTCMKSIQDVSSSNPENAESKATVPNSVAGGKPAPDVPAGKDRWQNAHTRPAPI
ncbi:hypothetical protein AK88_05645 [Plasmodium fragile]|uniref:Schizont-infected cell agglutination extracellular alpha domain-containing protein n=1 Tax=Plasmodium fragile TaxID=5857 RepID=A0A0D9QD25_PLAFR|nr:uncharacterized protein AK88_05645 [Plasmodium fragile]KJP84722.1 hypothetical protein AK88_05645 [Plasmodium fragile]